MRSASLKTTATGTLWRSERIHLTNISREPDNRIERSDCNLLRKEDDSGIHKFLHDKTSLRYCPNGNKLPMVDASNESEMSETIFPPAGSYINDGSDFSDTSATSLLSSKPNANDYCYQCASPSTKACYTPNRRRRRRVVSKSLVLDNSKLDHYIKSPQHNKIYNGLSDSGMLIRTNGYTQADSDSSSSSCSVAPVKFTRRKPKSNKSLPPGYCYIGYGNQPLYPGHIFGNYCRPSSWVTMRCYQKLK